MIDDDLIGIIRSPDFREDLREMSSYLASIQLERPIVCLFAKYLWRRDRIFTLERVKKHDLTIWLPDKSATVHVEFKYNTDLIVEELKKEFSRLGDNPASFQKAFEDRKNDRGMMHKLFKDFRRKDAHFFIWVICSRDLVGVDPADGVRIVNWKKYSRQPNSISSTELHSFIFRILRAFDISETNIKTEIIEFVAKDEVAFPSIFHFFVCKLPRSKSQECQ